MPLVVITGRPCTGKSTLATALGRYLRERGVEHVAVVNDESLGVTKAHGCTAASDEKASRGALKAAVERLTSSERTVIADGLNYVKGFRYELFCIARGAGTTHVVVLVEAELTDAHARNAARGEGGEPPGGGAVGGALVGDAYPARVINDIWSRFETPDPRNRWDCPLVRVRSGGGGGGSAAQAHIAAGGVKPSPSPLPPPEPVGCVVGTGGAAAADAEGVGRCGSATGALTPLTSAAHATASPGGVAPGASTQALAAAPAAPDDARPTLAVAPATATEPGRTVPRRSAFVRRPLPPAPGAGDASLSSLSTAAGASAAPSAAAAAAAAGTAHDATTPQCDEGGARGAGVGGGDSSRPGDGRSGDAAVAVGDGDGPLADDGQLDDAEALQLQHLRLAAVRGGSSVGGGRAPIAQPRVAESSDGGAVGPHFTVKPGREEAAHSCDGGLPARGSAGGVLGDGAARPLTDAAEAAAAAAGEPSWAAALDAVFAALFERPPAAPSRATSAAPAAPASLVADLDRATDEVLTALAAAAAGGAGAADGDAVRVPGVRAPLLMTRTLTAAELHRLRARFIRASLAEPPPPGAVAAARAAGEDVLRAAFVRFLSAALAGGPETVSFRA